MTEDRFTIIPPPLRDNTGAPTRPVAKEILNGHPGFYELLKKMADIHSRKNGNYAKKSDALSNFRMSRELGIDPFKGCLVRMSDKWSRIQQLSQGVPDLVGESLEDTLLDLANYAVISILLLRENYKTQREEV